MIFLIVTSPDLSLFSSNSPTPVRHEGEKHFRRSTGNRNAAVQHVQIDHRPYHGDEHHLARCHSCSPLVYTALTSQLCGLGGLLRPGRWRARTAAGCGRRWERRNVLFGLDHPGCAASFVLVLHCRLWPRVPRTCNCLRGFAAFHSACVQQRVRPGRPVAAPANDRGAAWKRKRA